MPPRNRTGTVRVPLSLDPTTNRVLESLASFGLFGKNKAEVAVGILGKWIWDNEEKLKRQGINLGDVRRSSQQEGL